MLRVCSFHWPALALGEDGLLWLSQIGQRSLLLQGLWKRYSHPWNSLASTHSSHLRPTTTCLSTHTQHTHTELTSIQSSHQGQPSVTLAQGQAPMLSWHSFRYIITYCMCSNTMWAFYPLPLPPIMLWKRGICFIFLSASNISHIIRHCLLYFILNNKVPSGKRIWNDFK